MSRFMQQSTSSIIFLFFLAVCVQAQPDESIHPYPPTVTLDVIQAEIDQAPKTHPRLHLNPQSLEELIQKVEKNPLHRQLKDILIKQADYLMNLEPVQRQLTGRRLLGKSRTCVQRVIVLAMAYHLSGEAKYARRCEIEMLAAAAFEDWNPSHFLDVAEMTYALAIGYDWLFHQLPEQSRSTIKDAILEKGVTLPFETKHNRWVKSTNNWGQVCHGGLTAGALAVMEDEPQLAAMIVHNALQNVPHSMKAYAPKGSYPEGPGYWSYGTTYNVLLIDVLEGVLGSAYGLNHAPGFAQTGQYLNLVTGPSGYTFNYADGGAGRNAEPAVFWFATKYNRPDWLYYEYDLLSEWMVKSERSNGSAFGGRFLPLTLLWMKKEPDSFDIEMPLHWSGEGHVPVTIHRSSWKDPNAVFVGLKAGSPSANHGQMDTGSFVLDADGVRWAYDLGAEGYHGIESRGMNLWSRAQDSDRWTIFRQQNFGHNTLVIDGQLQVAKNAGVITEFSDDTEHPNSIVDLSPVYEGQSESVRRGIVMLSSNEIIIQDELTGLQPNTDVRWGMITKGEVRGEPGTSLELQYQHKTLRLQNGSRDHSAKWEIINTSEPRNEWDSPNPDTRMVALQAKASDEGTLTYTVFISPGSVKESAIKNWKPKPLDEWNR